MVSFLLNVAFDAADSRWNIQGCIDITQSQCSWADICKLNLNDYIENVSYFPWVNRF